MTTFPYSERQTEVAGTDSVELGYMLDEGVRAAKQELANRRNALTRAAERAKAATSITLATTAKPSL